MFMQPALKNTNMTLNNDWQCNIIRWAFHTSCTHNDKLTNGKHRTSKHNTNCQQWRRTSWNVSTIKMSAWEWQRWKTSAERLQIRTV